MRPHPPVSHSQASTPTTPANATNNSSHAPHHSQSHRSTPTHMLPTLTPRVSSPSVSRDVECVGPPALSARASPSLATRASLLPPPPPILMQMLHNHVSSQATGPYSTLVNMWPSSSFTSSAVTSNNAPSSSNNTPNYHSRFTPLYYLGPKLLSEQWDVERARSREVAARSAAVASPSGVVAPVDTQHIDALTAPDQHALLQSQFQHLDNEYPPPTNANGDTQSTTLSSYRAPSTLSSFLQQHSKSAPHPFSPASASSGLPSLMSPSHAAPSFFSSSSTFSLPPGFRLVRDESFRVDNDAELDMTQVKRVIDQLKQQYDEKDKKNEERHKEKEKEKHSRGDRDKEKESRAESDDPDAVTGASRFVVPPYIPPFEVPPTTDTTALSLPTSKPPPAQQLAALPSAIQKKKVDKTVLIAHLPLSFRCSAALPHTLFLSPRDGSLSLRSPQLRAMQTISPPALVVCLLSIGNHVWAGLESGMIVVYDGVGRKLRTLPLHHSGAVACLALGPGGVYSGSSDFTLVHWHERGEFIQQFLGHSGGVRCILPLSAGRVWSGGDDGVIKAWNSTGHVISTMSKHVGSVLAMVTTGEAVISAGEDGCLMQWSYTFQLLRCVQVSTSRISSLTLMGPHIYSTGQDPRIHVWTFSLDLLQSLTGHQRFCANMTKLHGVVERRVALSQGLGEDHTLIWQQTVTTDDWAERYCATVSELANLKYEIEEMQHIIRQLRAHIDDLEKKRLAELNSYKNELNNLLLQLAQALSNKELLESELAKAKKEISSLAAQNAKLRNELRIHIEKLRISEEVINKANEQTEIKAEHVDRLENEYYNEMHQWKSKCEQLDRDNVELRRLLAAREGELSSVSSEYAAARSAQHAADTALANARAEHEQHVAFGRRAQADIDAKMTIIRTLRDELTAVKKADNERISENEKHIMDLVLELRMQKEENDNIRNELRREKEKNQRLVSEAGAKQQEHKDAISKLQADFTQLQHQHEELMSQHRSLSNKYAHEHELREDWRRKYMAIADHMDEFSRGLKVMYESIKDIRRRDRERTNDTARDRSPSPSHAPAMPPYTTHSEDLHALQDNFKQFMVEALSDMQKLYVGMPTGEERREMRERDRQQQQAKENARDKQLTKSPLPHVKVDTSVEEKHSSVISTPVPLSSPTSTIVSTASADSVQPAANFVSAHRVYNPYSPTAAETRKKDMEIAQQLLAAKQFAAYQQNLKNVEEEKSKKKKISWMGDEKLATDMAQTSTAANTAPPSAASASLYPPVAPSPSSSSSTLTSVVLPEPISSSHPISIHEHEPVKFDPSLTPWSEDAAPQVDRQATLNLQPAPSKHSRSNSNVSTNSLDFDSDYPINTRRHVAATWKQQERRTERNLDMMDQERERRRIARQKNGSALEE